MKKLILPWGSSPRGAQLGRRDSLPENPAAPIKLRVERLRWVSGDYDQFGAYWGGGNGTYIFCGWGEDDQCQVRVFVRAANRNSAKQQILQKIPAATFFDGRPK